MRIFKSGLILACMLQTLNLYANVKFDFVYEDAPGKGFHARPEAKVALESVGKKIGGWLQAHNARIKIKVRSDENTEECKDISYYRLSNNRKGEPCRIREKIISANTKKEKDFDDVIYVNFSCPFSFTDDVSGDEYDFKALMLHKITRILGCAVNLNNFERNEELESLFIQVLTLGIQKLSGETYEVDELSIKNRIDELKQRGEVIDVSSFENFIDKLVLNNSMTDSLRNCFSAVIAFGFKSISDVQIDLKNEISLTNALIADGLKVKENEIDYKKLLQNFIEKIEEVNFTYFEKFLTYENGEKMFDKESTLKMLRDRFRGHEEDHYVYFKGYSTVKYTSARIELEKASPHFVVNRHSILSNFWSQKGRRSRHWDKEATAILLDLGYTVNNQWTRKWGENEIKEAYETVKEVAGDIYPEVKKQVKHKIEKYKKKAKDKLKKLL